MKKIKIIAIILAVVMIMGTTTAFAATSCPNSGSISVSNQDKNSVTFSVTVKGGSGYVAWLSFGDNTGISLTSGTGHVQHVYASTGSYTAAIYMENVKVCQTTIYVNSVKNYNKIYLDSLSLNKLAIEVDCYDYSLKLDWGDGTNVILSQGKGQIISHDYGYNVKGTKSYTISFGCIGVATVVINDNGTASTFTNINNWSQEGCSTITDWTVSNITPPPTTTPINDWKINNTVTLNLNTEIRQGAGTDYQINTIVSGSYWLVKVIDGPKFIGRYTWWKIQAANGTTGWVRQDLADPSSLF